MPNDLYQLSMSRSTKIILAFGYASMSSAAKTLHGASVTAIQWPSSLSHSARPNVPLPSNLTTYASIQHLDVLCIGADTATVVAIVVPQHLQCSLYRCVEETRPPWVRGADKCVGRCRCFQCPQIGFPSNWRYSVHGYWWSEAKGSQQRYLIHPANSRHGLALPVLNRTLSPNRSVGFRCSALREIIAFSSAGGITFSSGIHYTSQGGR
ncbi:hypothetical protein FB45DRAFT_436414 [Roridomyces roridus]|uniref:Uncharacterized protein n=1 Tax=Roridomyces roridus TaxID=1738132 RepID=A0AAD7F7D5_9AGAR|nr:hypothetical protein FB45DRAFT_436414 [Roridomyces roridus]